ncbi:MAG: hypothetical protein OXG46_11725 [Chloroflexi bacterium]|nr:hypothetical protein [Chloroflexota bacterium]MCY3937914.1 hypothetical protein [Chloroflexota bacterium]
MIDSGTLYLLIEQTQGRYGNVIWEKQGDHRYVIVGGESSYGYDIVLDNSGVLPTLTMTRHESRETDSVTDLDPRPGFFKDMGDGLFAGQYWIATLLDKVTGGETSMADTIEATRKEGERSGIFKPLSSNSPT